MKIGNITRTLIRFLIVSIIFYLLYRSDRLDIGKLGGILDDLHIIGVAALFIAIPVFITSARWQLLLQITDLSFSYVSALKLTFLGLFFSTVVPGSVGGDVVKAYYTVKGQQQKTNIVVTIFFDRFVGLYAMLLTASLAILTLLVRDRLFIPVQPLLTGTLLLLGVTVILIFAAITAAPLLFMSPAIGRTLKPVEKLVNKLTWGGIIKTAVQSVSAYARRPAIVFKALGLSIISQSFLYSGLYLLAAALGSGQTEAVNYFFLLPLCLVVNALPLAPAGLGVGEAGFGELFLLFGLTQGAEVALLYHILYLVFIAGTGGLVYLFGNLDFKTTTTPH
ncbi:MAG: flippase-like domain-containing protein [Deltaproteobacteria bacterium]|nr:flippase-like domain-containing protein [Deltaproteobacteria bacterium]